MPAIDDLKQKTDDQLQQQLGDLKREQFNLRFQSATNQLEKPSPAFTALQRAPPHHRAHPDAAKPTRPGAGQGVRRL